MALTYSEPVKLGTPAPEFSLPGTDGKTYTLSSFKDARALAVIFMCNHCPYVKAVQGRINELAKEFQPRGVRVVGINSNDAVKYPDDSFEAMRLESEKQGYVFPYLHDESQTVAKNYGAVCTPDFYAFGREDAKFVLRYRGRLDDSWKIPQDVMRRDLAEALQMILAGKSVLPEQQPSMGCSIKWK